MRSLVNNVYRFSKDTMLHEYPGMNELLEYHAGKTLVIITHPEKLKQTAQALDTDLVLDWFRSKKITLSLPSDTRVFGLQQEY